jgi:glyoxalase family protein
MPLEGVHHVTAITADAPGNVEFYVHRLGLRMVKKTVNFDAPDVYHLYYGDERGTPGSIMTFFEFPGAGRGRAGDGMIHRILWRVGSPDALDFWSERLGSGPVFADPEGLEHELVVVAGADAPLTASREDIPAEFAIQGFHGVRAYAGRPGRSNEVLETTGFVSEGDGAWRLTGERRHGVYHQDPPPYEPGLQGAGTVHHVAWSAADDGELELYRQRLREVGAHPTPIIDRQYFHSVYYREPGFVLFELATRDIGFDVDEPLESLGHDLKLPPQHEHLRAQLEQTLTPLPT